ncbi:hypothetical protein HY212_01975 [Candidatus Pacearchaeota archaeon]|nr:hypothetical protein [Candidatus Pacearchaeota archaeon]
MKNKAIRALTLKLNNKPLPKSKRSQMKIQQTTFMLLAVTLFFALVGLAFVSFKFSGLKNEATDLKEKNAQLLVAKLASSPEFSCGNSFGNDKIDCIDANKVMALKQEENKYSSFWGVSNIEIIKIYPKINGNVECTSANFPNCNIIKIHPGGVSGTYEYNFVTLCRKETSHGNFYDKCELAKLLVSYNVT